MTNQVTDFKYKYHARCVVCKYCRRHPEVKAIIINAHMFNPQSKVTIAEIHRNFFLNNGRESVVNHMKRHILTMDHQPVMNVMKNSKDPVIIKATDRAVVESRKEQFERTLDEFIDQFDEGLRNKQFRLTVKDGLTALKIKSDMVNKNKDRKADVLKVLAGARGERKPDER